MECGGMYGAPRGTYRRCEACRHGACAWCGLAFVVVRHDGTASRFCSLVCRSKARFAGKRSTVECAQCGTSVSRTAHQLARRAHFFCTRSCRSLFHWADQRVRARIVAALKASPKVLAHRMTQKFPSKATSIERAMSERFDREGLRYEANRAMFGRWQPDFVFESEMVVVQADGRYWHAKPRAVCSDRRFNRTARAAGWCVIRLREAAINQDPERCLRRVLRAIGARTGRSAHLSTRSEDSELPPENMIA